MNKVWCLSIKAPTFVIAIVNIWTNGLNEEVKTSEIISWFSSKAEFNTERSPAKLSVCFFATRSAEPTSLTLSIIFCRVPSTAFSIKMPAADIASWPNISFLIAAWAAWGNFCSAVPMSFNTSGIALTLPWASFTDTPKAYKAFCPSVAGATKRVNTARIAVPAWEPRIALSPSLPAIAATVSKSTPIDFATGATYFMVSPNPCRSVEELAKVLTIVSATRLIWLASSPKPFSIEAAISEALAKSTWPAAARFNIPGIALSMSSDLKPAIARYVIPSAAWEAENTVDFPKLRAPNLNFSKSSAEAFETAPTLDMVLSNSIPNLIGAVNFDAKDLSIIAWPTPMANWEP